MRTRLFFGAALVLLLASPFAVHAQGKNVVATIYSSDACGSCGEYRKDELVPFLEAQQIGISQYDYVNDLEARKKLTELEEKLGIPFDLRSHFMTFLSNGIVFAGHIPASTMEEILESRGTLPDTFVVYNDQMEHGDPDMNSISDFALWPDKNGVYYTDTMPVLAGFNPGTASQANAGTKHLLPLVATSGLLDSLNPCAFAVLLLLIGFLFAIRRTRKNVLMLGMVYILGIFLAYVGIGFGILKAIALSDTPHFVGRIAAWIVIGIGLFGLARVAFPELWTPFVIPEKLKPAIQSKLYKATFPAALIAGVLVGLCTFPCSGGIYVAILGLLSARTTRIEGTWYLLLYNVMFVLPLVIVLAFSSNKRVVDIVQKQKQKNKRLIHIALNVLLIAISAVILLFYV